MKPKQRATKGHPAKSERQGPVRAGASQKREKTKHQESAQAVHILERISDGFVAFDKDMNYTYVNKRGGELLGRKPEDLIGKNYWKEYPEAAGTPFAQAYVRALETQEPIHFEDYYEPWGRWFENRIYPSEDGISIFFTEVTKRKQAENRIKYLARLYATLSQINQAIVRNKDQQELFEAVCRVAVKFGQFHMAWIGLADPTSGDVKVVAYAGEAEEYLEHIHVNFKNKGSRNGPTATAIRKNEVVLVNDVQTDERIKPWRNEVLRYGYRSLAAVPFCVGQKVIGVLDLYATEVDFFTEDELSLLKEIGTDISFALDVMLIEEERERAHQKVETQLERLSALRTIDIAITSGLDLRLILDTFVLHVVTQSGVDAADVLTFHPDLGELEFVVGRGFRIREIPRKRIPLGENHAGRAVLEQSLIHIPDLGSAQLSMAEADRASREGFVCYCAIPLIAKGEVKGVLELFHRSSQQPEADWLDFIQTLAGQAAIAMADAELFHQLKRSNLELLFAYDETIEAWSRFMDLRDKETVGHTQRVTDLVLRLASIMGVEETDSLQMRRGALLHDIGKMGIPDHILFKPNSLTEEEWILMRKHPQYAFEMLAPISFLRPALDIPYCHHEKWDGTGYPRGLKGEEIPLVARIFAIVDVYDALTSDRPYRSALSTERALDYIRSSSGSHFDPEVVEAFLGMLQEEKECPL